VVFARRSILSSLQSLIVGTKQWESRYAIHRATPISSSDATTQGNHDPPRCSCSTALATTTACFRIFTESVFPIQVGILLSEPQRDFTGGEFVLTEQRPRMQSRPEVVPLHQGDAVAFAVHHRPVQGTPGTYRVNLRHGVSRLRSGKRHTVGIIFHDAN
jgi:hypothetical protein